MHPGVPFAPGGRSRKTRCSTFYCGEPWACSPFSWPLLRARGCWAED
jgi:hypothetical protein